MSESFELLPTSVLVIGLVLGAIIAWRVLRRTATPGAPDLDLRRRDLELRRDELYARLKQSDTNDLNPADRNALERSAATVLRELDQLPRAKPAKDTAAAPAQPAGATLTSRHPLLAGALLGGGMVGLVAVLIFLAQRDAQPAPPEQQPPAASGSEAPFDRGQPPLPPEIAQMVSDLQQRIEAAPSDAALRRDLMSVLLVHSQFFDAFQQARVLLDQDPGDAQALYTSAIVRYTMGQPNEAIEQFDLALQSQPAYEDAALMKGLILMQLGDRDGAMNTWETGIEAAGGEASSLQHVLGLAREGKSAEEILSTPPPR